MNKKAVVFIVILIVSTILIYAYIILSNIKTYKYLTRYGHFVVGGKLKYSHVGSDAIQLEDGRILMLGNDFTKEESEIYDPKTDTVTPYQFPNNIKMRGSGLALKDNKIFLLKVCDTRFFKCDNYLDYKENFAVYDMKTKQIQNFGNTQEKLYGAMIDDYFVLNDGRVIVLTGSDKILTILIYDPNTDKLDVFKAPAIANIIKGIQINDEEILILNSKALIQKYNINTKTLSTLKSKISLHENLYTKIGDKILILGKANLNPYDRNHYNELYDIKADKIQKIPPMYDKSRVTDYDRINLKTYFQALPINQDLVLITGGEMDHWGTANLAKNTTEIYDIKANKFIPINRMNYAHTAHHMIKLNNGEILLIGGKVYPVKEKQIFIPFERHRIEKFIIKKGLQDDYIP